MAFAPQVLWLPVGGDCNCRCDRCTFVRLPPMHPEQARLMMEGPRPGCVVLQGPGEPPLRDDLERLVHAVRRGGAGQVSLVTNGRVLAYPRRAEALASLDLGLIAVTIRHPSSDEHDRLTRAPGSYEQTLAGLRNLARALQGRRTDLVVRAPIHEAVRGRVAALALLARSAGADAVWFDGDEDPVLADEVAAVARQGHPVRWRGAIESLLLPETVPARSSEGDVPARFHDGVVSLVVRTGCANACLFCTTRIIQEAGRAPWSLSDLTGFHDALEQGRQQGLTTLRLVAVEPLEHPDIPRLLQRAQDLGFTRIEAWTSGRALLDEPWADRLAQAGLTHIDVPLFGPDAAVHDAVADVPGSFDETMVGLGHALTRFEVVWHLVLTKQNLGALAATVDMARERGLGELVSVLLPSPSSHDPGPYEAFAPRFTDIIRALAALPPDLAARLLERGLAQAVPPCVVEDEPGLAGVLTGITPPRPQTLEEVGDDQPGAEDKLRTTCPLIARCAAANRCPGLHTVYLDLFGTDELTPLPSAVEDPA